MKESLREFTKNYIIDKLDTIFSEQESKSTNFDALLYRVSEEYSANGSILFSTNESNEYIVEWWKNGELSEIEGNDYHLYTYDDLIKKLIDGGDTFFVYLVDIQLNVFKIELESELDIDVNQNFDFSGDVLDMIKEGLRNL